MKEAVPYLTHHQIVSGPDLEKLIEAILDRNKSLEFTFAPHAVTVSKLEPTPFLAHVLLSLGNVDRDGMRRIEFVTDFDDDWIVRFRGIYDPVTKTGTGSLERVRKPAEPMPPTPPLTGEQVAQLLQPST